MTFLKVILLDDLIDFLDFWFHHFPRRIIRLFFDFVYYADKFFAVRANIRNFTKPLFGDYSIIGYAITFVYRSLKIVSGCSLYFFVFCGYFIFIIGWLLLPIILLTYGVLF